MACAKNSGVEALGATSTAPGHVDTFGDHVIMRPAGALAPVIRADDPGSPESNDRGLFGRHRGERRRA